jgi:transcriptional regulator with XRE-family HTH domain
MPVKIKTFRTQLGMTQQQLAEKLRTTQQTIARWEGGKSEIPVPMLKELALLFGRSVDELLGIETAPDTWRDTPFAIAEQGTPYGSLKLSLTVADLEYPIDEKARESLLHQLERLEPDRDDKGQEPWLHFWTLDNKIVLANPECIKQLELVGDDVEAMPTYEHPEVYRALEELDDPEFEIGEGLKAQCQRVIDELGDEEAAMRAVTHARVLFRNGEEAWQSMMEANDAFDYWNMELNYRDLRRQSFIRVESEGYYRDRFVNLAQLVLIEVPANRFHRLNATE